MDFILPIIFSILLAPFVGLGCAALAVGCLRAICTARNIPPPKNTWILAIPVFAVCTWFTPLNLVMGWAMAVDAITDAENKIAVATSSEFWQEFAYIEKDLHDVKADTDPVYQKLQLLMDKYLWGSKAIVGAKHGDVRELAFKVVDYENKGNLDSSKLIAPTALVNSVPSAEFDNWMIGTGFTEPKICESVHTHLYEGPSRYFAKDLLFTAKRTGNRIDVDVYTDIDTRPAYDNTPPVTEFLKRNLGSQFFYLVLGDVKFHSLSENKECKGQPIDKIHQAFANLLTPSELKTFESKVTDNMCVEGLSTKDYKLHQQFRNPYLNSTVPEAVHGF